MTLQDDYKRRCATPSDINEHLPVLFEYSQGRMVVEFGTRTGNSTAAFLAAGATVYSYDIEVPSFKPAEECWWTFTRADTGSDILKIPYCDILFIDSLHTGDHVRKELRHAEKVGELIILHDTVLFGTHGEIGQEGITSAIYEFLASNHEWRVQDHFKNNNGLTILRRWK